MLYVTQVRCISVCLYIYNLKSKEYEKVGRVGSSVTVKMTLVKMREKKIYTTLFFSMYLDKFQNW